MPNMPNLNWLSALFGIRPSAPTNYTQGPINTPTGHSMTMTSQQPAVYPMSRPIRHNPFSFLWTLMNNHPWAQNGFGGVICTMGLSDLANGWLQSSGCVNCSGGSSSGGSGSSGGGGAPIPTVKKPAVYFYPTEPTEVTVTLDPSIILNIDIPRYNAQTGWRVMAYPNGQLEDLQPELTNLTDWNTHQVGFDYLIDVKQTGRYPYIYWDGQQTQQPEPSLAGIGSIVNTEDLRDFMDNTLTEIGLNETEKADFMSYWIPTLSLKPGVTHVRVAFMLSTDVETYLPMTVSPTPTTIARILMLVELNPDKATYTTLKPQLFEGFNRTGFTVVEWGGMVVSSPNYNEPTAVTANSAHY